MTLAYPLRLLCLCLAVLFLVNLAAGTAVTMFAPVAVRLAERLNARRAARFLLMLRFAPAALAALSVGGLCVPSFLWLEPGTAAEEMGFACLAAALSSVTILAFAGSRTVRAILHSRAWVRGEHSNVMASTGIFRPQVLVSRDVLEALSTNQLAAALRHERGHQLSRDNLKRLCIVMAPGVLPFYNGFGTIERAWVRFSEWAADDYAVGGDPLSSTVLASALVRVARMGGRPASFLVTTLIDGPGGLAERVDRLLKGARAEELAGPAFDVWGTVAFVLAFCVLMLRPGTLGTVHSLLEYLVR
jgi:hypothetical protein